MKKIVYFIFAMLGGFMMTSCSEEELDSNSIC